MARWGTRYTFGEPIVWILHVGHAWIPAAFAMRAAALVFPSVLFTAAAHAMTAGAFATMALGVMSRAALGHTGRLLVASRTTIFSYGFVIAGGLLRVAAAFFGPPAYAVVASAAGVSWSLGFLLFAGVYFPVLTRPRVDGQPE